MAGRVEDARERAYVPAVTALDHEMVGIVPPASARPARIEPQAPAGPRG
jgi:hypothetical protein